MCASLVPRGRTDRFSRICAIRSAAGERGRCGAGFRGRRGATAAVCGADRLALDRCAERNDLRIASCRYAGFLRNCRSRAGNRRGAVRLDAAASTGRYRADPGAAIAA